MPGSTRIEHSLPDWGSAGLLARRIASIAFTLPQKQS